MSKLLLIIRRCIYFFFGTIDRVFRRVNPITIFAYHGMSNSNWRFDISPEIFARQMSYLSKRYKFVSLADIEQYLYSDKPLPSPVVAITFDDGYKSISQIQSVLDKYHIPATVFALSKPKFANRQEMGIDTPLLSTTELKKLHKKGWSIGCHSATHANFSSLTSSEITSQVVQSATDLHKNLMQPITYFAFPRGRYTPAILAKLKQARFRLGLTMDDAKITHNTNPLTLPRVGVDRTHSLAEFPYLNSPSVITFRRLIKASPLAKWLVL